MSENLGEIYVKIKADVSNLAKEMEQIKSKIAKDSKDIDAKLNFRARLDNSLAKMKITELQSYRDKLQARFNQQLKTNVDAGSINRTKTLISSVNSQLEGLGKTGMSTGEKIIAGFVALGGIRGAFRFIGESVKLFFEQAKAVAGVEQAVRRTGGAAGYTAVQLKAMASELQNITGVGDEEILKGVTKQLLTFTQITGTSFKRAQEAVLDLNAVIAGGEVGGLTSQAIQLGKALENPIAGVGALSRAGVTFTEEQKKMIAGFIRQNDLMSAQDIILKEIENKYGGQAKALAGALGGTKQYAAAVGDLKEAIGGLIANIPGLNWLIINLTGGMKTITKWFQGASYEAEQLRLELDNLKTAASQIQVKGIGISDLKARKEYNDQIIEQNKTEVKLLQAQLTEAGKKVRFSNSENDAIANKIKSSLQAIQIAKGENEAYDKQIETIENVNKSWDKTGKTLGQVQDRISFLEEQKLDLEVKGIDAKKVQKEIDDLTKYIDTSKSDKTITTKFESQIPIDKETGEKYKAKQVAIYEDLKFAAKGYADYALAVIEMKYQQELADAKGNSKAILKAEENKTLGIARLNQEMIDLQKEGSDATNKIVADSLKEREKELEIDLEKEAQVEADSYIKRQDALNKYYDALSFKDEGYLAYRIENIKKEAKIIEEATNNKLLGEQFLISETQKLWQEYSDWKIEEWKKNHKVEAAALDSMKEGFTQAFQLIKIRTSQSASALENVFVDMANSFIAQVERMIVKWAELQLLEGIVGVVTAPFTGGASAVVAAAAHSGGEFLGTSSGIKKMAAGGSIIIPPGYPNDSYPILVESGERVTVNSTSNVGMQDRLLKQVVQSLQVLNANTIEGQLNKPKQNAIGLYGKIEGHDIYISNKRAGKVIRRTT